MIHARNSFRKITGTVLVTVFILATTLEVAAAKYYIKLGDIKGEAQDREYEEWIDLYAFSMGIEVDFDPSSGRTGARPTFERLAIRKELDKATPYIMQHCAAGEVVEMLELAAVRDSGDAHLDYLKITMTNVMITSIQIDGESSDDRPSEEVSFYYETIKFEYIPINEDGGGDPPIEFYWDIEAGTAQ